MTMTVLCSATGAPGVTTTALALAWVWPWVRPDRRVLVVDADAAGSGILPGYLNVGTAPGGGVLALAAERTALSAEAVFEHSIALDPGDQRVLLTGVTDPGQARTARSVWTGLGEVASRAGQRRRRCRGRCRPARPPVRAERPPGARTGRRSRAALDPAVGRRRSRSAPEAARDAWARLFDDGGAGR